MSSCINILKYLDSTENIGDIEKLLYFLDQSRYYNRVDFVFWRHLVEDNCCYRIDLIRVDMFIVALSLKPLHNCN